MRLAVGRPCYLQLPEKGHVLHDAGFTRQRKVQVDRRGSDGFVVLGDFMAPEQRLVGIAFGGIAYAVAGLGLLRRVLLTYFSDRLTALTLGLMVLAFAICNLVMGLRLTARLKAEEPGVRDE